MSYKPISLKQFLDLVITECDAQGLTCSHACVNATSGPYCFCPAGMELAADDVTCTGIIYALLQCLK